MRKRFLGRGGEDLSGRTIHDLVAAPLADALRAHELQVLGDRRPARREGSIEVDGQERTFLSDLFPILGADGSPNAIAYTSVDVSGQRHTERALLERSNELAEAQRLAHVGSWYWWPSEDRIRWSVEMYSIYGQDPATFKPTFAGVTAVVHPDDTRCSSGPRRSLARITSAGTARAIHVGSQGRTSRSPPGSSRWQTSSTP